MLLQEAGNKVTKFDRLHHARKHNCELNLRDIFTRASRRSDPLVSPYLTDHLVKRRKKMPITETVFKCLEMPAIQKVAFEVVPDDHQSDAESSDGDTDSDMDCD